MPPASLSKIPAGSDIFLDANVLIYGLGNLSLECVGLLSRCAAEQLTGITSFSVVSEVTHRLMLEEAKSKGLAGIQPRKTLEQHPDRIQKLTAYWIEIERLLSLNLLILTVDEDTVRAAQKERQNYGLLNNDSLVVASMRIYGISMIATRDNTFQRVTGISVFSPHRCLTVDQRLARSLQFWRFWQPGPRRARLAWWVGVMAIFAISTRSSSASPS